VTEDLTDLKKHIFFELFDLSGRVYIRVTYSEDLMIGKRGFQPEEKEKGLTLVFNTGTKFEWGEQGISAVLSFGTKTEKCFIPARNIISVFSPDLNAQFSVSPSAQKTSQSKKPAKKAHSISKAKVIKVDFSRKS
jgi:hypothetical protein